MNITPPPTHTHTQARRTHVPALPPTHTHTQYCMCVMFSILHSIYNIKFPQQVFSLYHYRFV